MCYLFGGWYITSYKAIAAIIIGNAGIALITQCLYFINGNAMFRCGNGCESDFVGNNNNNTITTTINISISAHAHRVKIKFNFYSEQNPIFSHFRHIVYSISQAYGCECQIHCSDAIARSKMNERVHWVRVSELERKQCLEIGKKCPRPFRKILLNKKSSLMGIWYLRTQLVIFFIFWNLWCEQKKFILERWLFALDNEDQIRPFWCGNCPRKIH